MGIQALQKFIEANCPSACVPVDLLKIARTAAVRRVGGRGNPRNTAGNRLCLVVDGECCLDRLYGGYFSDWVCGGQWNRMVQFLSVLIQTIQSNNIELAVFFNGSLEQQRLDEWQRQQQVERRKVGQVLKHVGTKATPPPKVWWVAPVGLRTCLRMALRHLNVTVMCTMDDHHQEVIAFCRENGFHGLMAEDAEYAIFDPPRYFSSAQLKLTYKGSLETREFILDEVARSLNLNPNRFCVLAALLGNYLLSEEDLAPFHRSLCPDHKGKVLQMETLIPLVVGFVRGLGATDDLDALGAQVFPGQQQREKVQRLKHCVQYYLNGTKDGFLRYRPSTQGRRHEPGCYPSCNLPPITEQKQQQESPAVNGKDPSSPSESSPPLEGAFPRSDPAKFASETAERELSCLKAYRQATGAYPTSASNGPTAADLADPDLPHRRQEDENVATNGVPRKKGSPPLSNGVAGSSSSSNSSSPGRQSPKGGAVKKGGFGPEGWSVPDPPKVPPEVMRTASERHQKGLMSPWIYQLLSQGALKIPVAIEDEVPRELPWGTTLFRPIRQMVYAVLFNMHHLAFVARQKREAAAATATTTTTNVATATDAVSSKAKEPASHSEDGKSGPAPVRVVEWVGRGQPARGGSRGGPTPGPSAAWVEPELVEGVQLGWPVPTVQRLWLGPSLDDKKCRLRAFLTCMRSDVPLMLNTAYVPQHLLIPCTVLRFLMADQQASGGERGPILRRQELDAFLAQAVSPQLMDAQSTQAMQLPLVSVRGTQLASLFLQGVENALFANDACGAPVPWLMCCPWLYFDGKLFHQKLLRAAQAKSLVEVCGGQIDQVAKVERMRAAVLEGLQVEFARAPLPHMGGVPPPSCFLGRGGYPPPRLAMGGMGPPPPGVAFRGGRVPRHHDSDGGSPPPGGAMIARGGQLEIAGVVVGSWGANYGQGPRRAMHGPHRGMPPQITSVGARYGGLGRGLMPRRPLSFNRRPGAPFNQLNRKVKKKPGTKSASKDESSPKLVGKGRGCTIETGDNCTIEVSELSLAKDELNGSATELSTSDCNGRVAASGDTDVPHGAVDVFKATVNDADAPKVVGGVFSAVVVDNGVTEQFSTV